MFIEFGCCSKIIFEPVRYKSVAAMVTAGFQEDSIMEEDSYLDAYWEDRLSGDCEDCYDDCEDCYDDEEAYYDDMDGDFDSAMRDAGHGTDEDYGYYGDHDDFYGEAA